MTRAANRGPIPHEGAGAGPVVQADSGLYLVLVRVPKLLELPVGRLGYHRLPRGWYVYTGSARRGLSARADRHLKREKRVRWHIDRLTAHADATALGAVLLPGGGHSRQLRSTGHATEAPDSRAISDECVLNQTVGRLLEADAPIPRFGAGDCRGGCPAHLWHSETRLSVAGLARLVTAAGLGETVVLRKP
jgi:Uri superfamily endonuclease